MKKSEWSTFVAVNILLLAFIIGILLGLFVVVCFVDYF